MNPSQILLYALLVVLIYLIYTYLLKGSSNKLTSLLTANNPYTVSEDSLKVLNGSQSIFNYTVSIWVYIDNWKVTPTEPKPILTIQDALNIYLGGTDNNLFVEVYPFQEAPSYFSSVNGYTNLMDASAPAPAAVESLTSMDFSTAKRKTKESIQSLGEGVYSKIATSATAKHASGKEGFASADNSFKTVVPAIPLQAWTNITVGIHDRALDIYINGKLVQSNLFPFVPGPAKSSIVLTATPGFLGWTSSLQYYPYNLTPSQIYDLYKAGYTGSQESLLSLLGRYSMKVVFVDNTQKP